jgi:DNA-binding NtrC family response regulator
MDELQASVLVVDDTPENLRLLVEILTAQGYEVRPVTTGPQALQAAAHAPPDLILLDINMPDMDGFEVCERLKTGAHADVPVIFLTAMSDPADKLRAFKAGGVDYITKPFDVEEVLARVGAHVALRRTRQEVIRGAVLRERLAQENVYLRREVRERAGSLLVGDSPAIRALLDEVTQVAPTTATVLLLGETGTGKELVATEIHERSPRAGRPMVRVNCAAIPTALIESELFGREKGAYTGALARQAGRFEVADGSTIFLDEVGELPLEVQVKLLRVLQERQIERLGSSRPLSVDVRVVAATNRDLERAVAAGTFREDLYYRLNVFPIQVPPLRERADDIAALVHAFVDEFAATLGKRIDVIAREDLQALQRHAWPGNVRELRNAIERAVIVSAGPRLRIEVPRARTAGPRLASSRLADVEREHIRTVLERTGWRVRGRGGAAELLDLKPSTLEDRMARLELRRPGR